MGVWEFVSRVVESLAWPALIFTGILLLRTEVRALLTAFTNLFDERVEEASFGRDGAKLKRFRKEVRRDLSGALEALPKQSDESQTASGSSPFFEEVKALAKINPAAAIASASARLEIALRDLLKSKIPDADRFALRRLIQAAREEQLLTDDEGRAAEYLAQLRNPAVHRGVATESDALEFAHLAHRIATAARLASGQTAPDGYPL